MTQDRLRDNPLRPARARRALLCWLGVRMWLEEALPGASERAR